MAGLTTRVTICYQDRYGFKWCLAFHMAPTVVDPNDPQILLIVAAINAITACVNITIELSKVNNISGSYAASPDYVNEDKGFFKFVDEDSVSHSYKLPSLKPGILDANSETINAAATNVPAFISAVTTYARGRGGADVTAYVSGYRKENRKPLKK